MNKMLVMLLTLMAAGLASCAVPIQNRGDTQDPTPEPRSESEGIAPPQLPDRGPAPELANEVWLNTEGPLRLSELRGGVVLLEFWTFG